MSLPMDRLESYLMRLWILTEVEYRAQTKALIFILNHQNHLQIRENAISERYPVQIMDNPHFSCVEAIEPYVDGMTVMKVVTVIMVFDTVYTMRSAGTVDSDVLFIGDSHINEKLLYFLAVVTLDNQNLVLVLAVLVIFFLLLLLLFVLVPHDVALSCDTAVGLEVLSWRLMYIFPEFEDLFEVEDVGETDDSGLTFSSSGVLLVDVDELIGERIVFVLVFEHFNNQQLQKKAKMVAFRKDYHLGTQTTLRQNIKI